MLVAFLPASQWRRPSPGSTRPAAGGAVRVAGRQRGAGNFKPFLRRAGSCFRQFLWLAGRQAICSPLFQS